jgi:hypothetical protein
VTYVILSLESGTILESYTTPDGAWGAAARILKSEPEALDSFAVAEFEDRHLVATCEGAELQERVREYAEAHEGAAA